MTAVDRSGMPAVYEPAEDSRLLAAAVADRLRPTDRVLEVGVGSGWVAERLAARVERAVVGTDVNPAACHAARERGLAVVCANVLDAIAAGSFDVVAINPPYLPTPPELEWDDPLEAALSGGPDGRRVIRPFLADVGRVLRPGGRAYLLASSLTGLDAIDDLAATAGLSTRRIAVESVPYEELVVLEITVDNS